MSVRRATLALCARARAAITPTSAAASSAPASSARPAAARLFSTVPVPPTPPPPPPPSGDGGGGFALGFALAGAAGLYYAKENGMLGAALSSSTVDYAQVRKAIADVMDKDGYDDGSYGPVLVRLAWHASGTYDTATKSGGSDGATMRFSPEALHGANAGLGVARDLLEPIKKKFPGISYADLWTLAGAVAIEEMGGPVIPWKPGRTDAASGASCPPDGRLPDAALDQAHIREVFEKRMGFTPRETVALIGAHALGRCHRGRSGYDGPWTRAPTTFSNDYFVQLLESTWRKRKWDGPLQYENKEQDLMMLPTDMALVWDKGYKKFVQEFAKDAEAFEKDFAAAFGKLLELGVKRAAPAAAA